MSTRSSSKLAMIVSIVTLLAVIVAPAAASSNPVASGVTTSTARESTMRVIDNGNVDLMGAHVESEYVATLGSANTKARRLREREVSHGRDDVNEAIAYLRESPRAAALLDRLNRSGSRISISINRQCNNDQKIAMGFNALIMWDPGCAYRTGHGSNSPALTLLHELVHTLHLAENPQRYLDSGKSKNATFDNDEERSTILYGEIPVARELGEAIRTNHHENRPFRVHDPTTR